MPLTVTKLTWLSWVPEGKARSNAGMFAPTDPSGLVVNPIVQLAWAAPEAAVAATATPDTLPAGASVTAGAATRGVGRGDTVATRDPANGGLSTPERTRLTGVAAATAAGTVIVSTVAALVTW